MKKNNCLCVKFIDLIRSSIFNKKAIIFIVLFLLINEYYPFRDFLNFSYSFIKNIIWCLYFFMIFMFFRKSSIIDKGKEDLIKDEEQAKKILKIFKSKCLSRKAMMISAKWGVGKTSFYNSSLKPLLKEQFPKMKILELSCFGVRSSNELIAEILDQTYMTELCSVFPPFRQIMISATNLKKTLIPRDLVIILDDFERFSGNFSELLGFFDYLVHQKLCHIIILCNEDEINAQEYNRFSEKIIIKQTFTMSPEQIRKILESDVFTFNNKKYRFSDDIINQFVKIIESTKNMRAAWDSHIDIQEISIGLMEKLKTIENISEDKKGEWLNEYFNKFCSGLFKATFIKNSHKSKEYIKYYEAVVDGYLKPLENGAGYK